MIPQPEDGGVRAHAPNTSHAQSGSVNIRRAIASSLPTPNSTQITAAGAYIALGWAVVPCCRLVSSNPPQCSAERGGYDSHKRCPKPGKIATRKWAGRSSTSIAELGTWWAYGNHSHGPNVALLMGPGRLIALDVDGPAGDARLADAAAVLGQLPDTLENITGRDDGGRHLLFTLPADATDAEVKALSKSVAGLRIDGQHLVVDESAPGLDLRAGDPDAGRSYILVAPSVHPSGAAYQWRGGPIAELPRRWFDALPREAPTRPQEAPTRLRAPSSADTSSSPPDQRRALQVFALALDRILIPAETSDSLSNNAIRDTALRLCRLALATGDDGNLTLATEAVIAAGLAAGHPETAVRTTVGSSLAAALRYGPAALPDRPLARGGRE